MDKSAFQLNQQFIDVLWEKIKTTDITPTPFEGFFEASPERSTPSKEHLAILMEVVYWTSYEKEEGYSASVSLIFKKPAHTQDTFCFDKPLQLTPKTLIKLAPALDKPRAHISVWPDQDGHLKIWGFKTGSEDFITPDLWIQSLGPGCVLITYGGRSLAALTGSKAVFVDPGVLMRAILPKITPRNLQSNPNLYSVVRYNTLLYVAQVMRSNGHGGTVLVVPEGNEWQSSIKLPIQYTGGTSFLDDPLDSLQPLSEHLVMQKTFFDFIRKRAFAKRQDRFVRAREKIRQQCYRIARLTAVDGALVMTSDRYTYCFGAKIQPVDVIPSSLALQVLRPVDGYAGTRLDFSDLGGTRHQSAAQFAYDQPQSIAIVASQDGDVTFFTRHIQSGELLAVQQAELALLHEGLSGALWNFSLFLNSPH